ncbi:MAG: type IV-A pilus assembly ATPase PilB [Desulfomonilia bacterium]|jgi:type IV pilus assembly protein PilB|uniref:Type IV pilus assembly protein TapB n=1 Tax=anaerobic digester metagenome TaxID=1263854 RepID=A0A485M0I3_9ZZZZ|nr:type IV-A pilus assembly ATPase PilB [Pseudomonadota bacterium]HON39032.1 type IV-A pilus assembly ATPase PilB [Deltaproteobacteria bacterium]HPD21345.1 type IV-A pilus assembly ATPase PilB [Deltaproteobacteria bacterium]HRS56017.1 type IV-A pilus assembly ATPase PilB [Desulfomonilia bacterium]HRV36083.1 type IV-A pilus assembly ATPase PilB [Desulfomonilia bacterium]
MANERIGDQLIKNSLITAEQLLEAQKAQKISGTRLGSQLVKLGHLTEEQLVDFLGKQYGLPSVILKEISPDPEVVKLIPLNIVQKYHAIPFERTGSTLKVAMTDPTNIFAVDDLKFLTGYSIDVHVTSEESLKWAMDHFYDQAASLDDALSSIEDDQGHVEVASEGTDISVGDLEKEADQAPVIKLVNLTLVDAIKKGASDIHVEPYEKYMRIRFRLDGMLQEVMKPPLRLKNALVSRLKIMAKLDIAERRLPQDGRIKLRIQGGKEVEFRVSVLPTLFGEKVVMRILDKSNLQLDMTKLGFEEEALKNFKEGIYKPWGMVLVTGPTGSGKTTTLYSAISELNRIDCNISTAEDPVEFNIPGINQVQMHEEIGLTFASALRSFLRQDPDIILVGEIRDFETAEIAIKAALTGHLVLSTLHTNDAPSTINRLLNMGIEPFLVASSVNLIVAQRLARKVCNACRERDDIAIETLLQMGMDPETASKAQCTRGKGCPSCGNTGFKGRVALYEVMPITDSLRELILMGASANEIKAEAINQGMKTLRQSGLTKILDGTTSVSEILRTTMAD